MFLFLFLTFFTLFSESRDLAFTRNLTKPSLNLAKKTTRGEQGKRESKGMRQGGAVEVEKEKEKRPKQQSPTMLTKLASSFRTSSLTKATMSTLYV